MGYFREDTIAAIATSLAGDGGIGIIRVSGPRALDAAQTITRGFERPQARYLHRVEAVSPDGTILDDGLAAYFPVGNSFTGEECVELQMHGGRFLLQSLLRALLETGKCRQALPGEFSFRAVRNDKLSLGGAEAVAQAIRARSPFEIEAARKNMGKARLRDIDAIAEALRALLARLELAIDFVDQDVQVVGKGEVARAVSAARSKLAALVERLRAARRIAEGVKITLTGAPNAGKSTLFNALLGQDRAIVSEQAGTTRDVITEEIALGRYRVRLADTAGMRSANGGIEKEGVARARALVRDSELAVLVIDATSWAPPVELPGKRPSVVVLNKRDLASFEDLGEARAIAHQAWPGLEVVEISASSGEGIALLEAALLRCLDKELGLGLDVFLPSEFQLRMLVQCSKSMEDAASLVAEERAFEPELLSTHVRSALGALSDLAGETTPDDVLTKIFSEFCIGK